MLRYTTFLTAVLLFVAPAGAAGSLTLGDPAPKLYVESWVKGGPVESFEKGKVYVIECWATWCGPCIRAIPHVSQLNTQYKDKGVVIIGMNVWESDKSKVEPFVEKMGDKMNYNVALDVGGRQGKTAEAWLVASGTRGIPHAFIVDGEGNVAWKGHPMSMDEPLAKIVAGTYDIKAEAERQAKQAKIQGKMRALTGELSKATRARDWDAAMDALDRIAKLDESMTLRVATHRFDILLTQKKDYKAAYELATSLGEGAATNDASALNKIAWSILDGKGVEQRNLKLALSLATRANTVSGGKDASILDTLARAQFDTGAVDKAIATQKKAVALDSSGRSSLKKTLDRYIAAKNSQK